MSRASSSPEIISTVQPVVERTHSRKARELRAFAECGRGYDLDGVGAGLLNRAVEAAQDADSFRHRLGQQ